VRTLREFQGGHIKNAKHIPVKELKNRCNEAKKPNRPVIAYCASGMRSGSAAGLLKSEDVDVINGGGMAKVKSIYKTKFSKSYLVTVFDSL
jgi:rhodanese-related sulfurtransferase